MNRFFSIFKTFVITIINSLKSLDSLIYSTDKDGFILDRIFMWPLESNPYDLKPFDEDELERIFKDYF